MSLSTAGSLASVFSLLITGWVVFEVRALHHFYKRHLILPRLILELMRHVRNARIALIDKRSHDVMKNLHYCDALLERIPKYADKALAARVQRSRDSIVKLSRDRAYNVLSGGNSVINEIDATIQSARAFTGDDIWTTRT